MTNFVTQHDLDQMFETAGPRANGPVHAAVRELSGLGMPVLDVALWISRGSDDLARGVATALEWYGNHFSYHQAKPWLQIGGWSAAEAAEWTLCGFEACEAHFISTLIRRDLVGSGDFRPPRDVERLWMRSGLTPKWVCLCVAGGVSSPEEAVRLYERRQSEPHLRGTLHLQGMVFRGADAKALTYDGLEAEPES